MSTKHIPPKSLGLSPVMGLNNVNFRPQARLDTKWLKSDLRSLLESDNLPIFYNQMVKDGEVTGPHSSGILNSAGATAKKEVLPYFYDQCTSIDDENKHTIISHKSEGGHYYCGMKVLTCPCCDGICGPQSGCNCGPCQKLEKEEAERLQSFGQRPHPPSLTLLESWNWGVQPSEDDLTKCIQSILVEQKANALEGASTTLSAFRIHQRFMVTQRYLIAMKRTRPLPSRAAEANLSKTKPPCHSAVASKADIWNNRSSSDKMAGGLARVGSRAALNFAFSFLRRAWRLDSSQPPHTPPSHLIHLPATSDTSQPPQTPPSHLRHLPATSDTSQPPQTQIPPSHLRVKLLPATSILTAAEPTSADYSFKESLEALETLPEATLFDESLVSSVWLDVVERSQKFLTTVVLSHIPGSTSGTVARVPLGDRHFALLLLLHLALQRARLSSLLTVIILLLQLWDSGRNQVDNRTNNHGTSAPLIPILKRFSSLPVLKARSTQGNEQNSHEISPMECLLRFLEIPDDDTVSVDLEQGAVIMLCHLDRLASPHMPPLHSPYGRPCQGQEVISWGWLSWAAVTSPSRPFNYCDSLAELGIRSLACGEKFFIILTQNGRLYSMPYAAEAQTPQLIQGQPDEEVVKIACHPDGKHSLALTFSGRVYSWGNGAGGRLGHGDQTSRSEPMLIKGLQDHVVVHISCGSTYSAAITQNGELFTWGKGNYGRLGHGSSDDHYKPTLVSALKGEKVVDVACGGGDAQTIAVTESGAVYSWGDGDYGKLGRGGSDCSKVPKLIDKLQDISRVFCGAQFTVALSHTGTTYTWGKGENHRLGHGSEDHVRVPKLVKGLEGKKVVKVAVGSMHVVVLTDKNEMYVWGRNDQAQLGDSPNAAIPEPTLMSALNGKPIIGVACGPAQTFAWSTKLSWSVNIQIPYVVDVCEETLVKINDLLSLVGEGLLQDKTPHQEQECMVVAALNLLRLQLHAAVQNQVDIDTLGISVGSSLLHSLKQRIVNLASTPGVLNTIQSAAQATLQTAWSILLPTAEERAKALSSLLPSTGSDMSTMSSGRRFMIDLLVSSLMADGGLELALNDAIKFEIQEVELKEKTKLPLSRLHTNDIKNSQDFAPPLRRSCDNSIADDQSHTLPLLHLVKQLLRNATTQTHMRLQAIAPENMSMICSAVLADLNNDKNSMFPNVSGHTDTDMPPSIQLLLRFQRILISQLMPLETSSNPKQLVQENEIEGAASLLRKYLTLLSSYVSDTLSVATSLATINTRLMTLTCNILEKDITGLLLEELFTSLLVIALHNSSIVISCDLISPLLTLLEPLDKFNLLAPGAEKEDNEDLSWPGIIVNANKQLEEFPVIRKADLENHNKDGGLWIVIKGKVYDVQEFSDILQYYAGQDATQIWEMSNHSKKAKKMMQSYFVGNYMDPEQEVVQVLDASTFSSPLVDTERTLAMLIGIYSQALSLGSSYTSSEIEYSKWISADFMQAGCQ
ncbi:E3 ubiquitin-protein ligase HERC2, partial [Armadillidium nasatum]